MLERVAGASGIGTFKNEPVIGLQIVINTASLSGRLLHTQSAVAIIVEIFSAQWFIVTSQSIWEVA